MVSKIKQKFRERKFASMKKMLIAGNANSIYLLDYIRYTLDGLDFEVFVPCFGQVSKDYLAEYDKLNVELIPLQNHGSTFGKYLAILKFIFFRLGGRIDFLNIQYVPSGRYLYFLSILQLLFARKSGLSFWGSDILRIGEKQAHKLESLLKRCKAISLPTIEMRKKFQVFYGQKYDSKIIAGCYFGSPIFSAIQEQSFDKLTAKKRLGLPTNKTIVHIGYSGAKAQQHLPVIEQLAELPPTVKQQLFIQIHLGYALESPEYCRQIQDALDRSRIEHELILDFLDRPGMATFRLAADVFIHAQITDAMSSTIREYLFAHAALFNPVWIPYPEFKKLGIDYLEYHNFSEIKDGLIAYLSGNLTIDFTNNQNLMFNNYSWEKAKAAWQSFVNG